MDPKDPRMRKFRADLSTTDYSDREFTPRELTRLYGFNPTQSRKICKRLNEVAKRISKSGSVTTNEAVPGSVEETSIDGAEEDTPDFATAAPGSRTVKKRRFD